MNHELFKEYAITLIPEAEREMFITLYDSDVIDRQRLMKACINDLYDKKFKENDNKTREAAIDVSLEFGVSPSTIYNVIYKFRSIRFVF